MIPSADLFVGQPLARRLLEGYLRKDKVEGTFLLLGQRGLGKTTLATVFARAIACEANREARKLWFCGECYACRSIASGNQPEFQLIRPIGTQIKVEQLDAESGVMHRMSLHPIHLNYRFLILDDAHTLNEQTGNQMLKLLEEPPSHSVFILTSDRAPMTHRTNYNEGVLPTVISRSNKITLIPMPEGDLAAEIRRNDPELSEETALQAARMGAGRFVDAVRLVQAATWRDAVARLAGGLHTGRDTVELAHTAAEFELAALWDKEQADLGLSEKDADKQVERTRRNELQRQALIAAYDRAALWLLRTHRPPAGLGPALAKLKARINQNVDSSVAQVAFEDAIVS